MQRSHRLVLIAILGVTLALHLWGIRHDFPYITEDPIFAKCAAGIATSGNPNPRWFGHPGSTLIYPLVPIFHVWNAIEHGGPWLRHDPQLRHHLDRDPAGFYLLGRLLTVLYALLSVLVIYELGRYTFGIRVGLIGSFLAAVYPTEAFAKVVRTDSASVFFAMLGVLCCLRLLDRPTLQRQMAAGTAIGLAIGTKYYLGTLVGLLLMVDALVLWRQRRAVAAAAWLGAIGGLLAVLIGFAVSTPYFFLDYATAARNLAVELRQAQPGADGLSSVGNLRWYITAVVPATLGWPQLLAAAVGIGRAVRLQTALPMLLLAYLVIFLVGISSSALHWARWIIPILPILGLFVAYGWVDIAGRLSTAFRLGPRWEALALVSGVALLAAQPLRQVVQLDRRAAQTSTGVVARQWIEQHIPLGSQIACEWETIPPPLDGYRSVFLSHLAAGGMLRTFARHGFRYLVTSSVWYEYFPTHADRYPLQAAFYRALLTHGMLLHEVQPSPEHAGPAIRIYEIALVRSG